MKPDDIAALPDAAFADRRSPGGACSESFRWVVDCTTCGKVKAPIGRSIPLAMAGAYCCEPDCPGYRQDPQPPRLWPNEGLR